MAITDVEGSGQLDAHEPAAAASYDVFLSYDSVDGRVVRDVARRLREANVTVWFDKESLVPGDMWQAELAARLMDSRACAVFVGPRDIAGWARAEMEVAVDRANTDHGFRVFAVLLPGIEQFTPSRLPRFLAMKQWVDLREGPESAGAVQDLINAIRGVAPRMPSMPDDGNECPYRGLEVFEEEHARFFFGREPYAQRLLEQLRQDRFVAIVGHSGVGKSSLMRAGLLPRLRGGALPGSEAWRVVVMRPGGHPPASLASKIVSLHSGHGMQETVDRIISNERTLDLATTLALDGSPETGALLVIVDQFEEIFTLCRDPADRAAFVRNLLHASTVPHGRTVVVVAMRADFYPQLTEFPEFAQLAQSHQMLVGPLAADELRAVIQEPAHEVGLTVEQGLAETILGDVERAPGNLPLLQLALLETWQNRRGRMLTLEGYRATGGVEHGLGERAEAVYEALSDAGKVHARNLFLRLIQPGEGTQDTRRRVALAEITAGDDSTVTDTIQQFVRARLLTTTVDDATGERRVELSHEAVISGWRRCARWVDEDRAGLLIHRRLTAAAKEWRRLGRSTDALYRGVQLEEATAWSIRAPGRLNWLEVDFLEAGKALDRSLRRARRRRTRTAFTALVVALVVMGAGALVALHQRDLATSRQLAAEAQEALNVDPGLSLTLALRALERAETTEADAALRQATGRSHGRSAIPSDGGAIYGVRLLPDGRQAVSGSEDGNVRVWDLTQGTVRTPFPPHRKVVGAVRVSPDGRTVASASVDGELRLAGVEGGAPRVVLTAPDGVLNVEFSHRGDLLAASLGDGTVRVLDVATGEERASLPAGRVARAAAFSADDAVLATGDAQGMVQIWRLSDRTLQRTVQNSGDVWGLEFSSSAPEILAPGRDGVVRIWDTGTGEVVKELAVSDGQLYVARFSPDGARVAAAGLDGKVHVWDRQGLLLATLRGHNGDLFDLDFDRSGSRLVSAGIDGSLRSWAVDHEPRLSTPVTTAVFDTGGTRIVTGTRKGELRMWRRTDLAPLLAIPDHEQHSQAFFSTDGSTIISYSNDGNVHVREATGGGLLARFAPQVGSVRTAASDPADQRLVVGGNNGRLVVVDYRGTVIETLSEQGSPVNAACFSPDGRSILAGRADGSITLWTPDRHQVLIKPVDYRPVFEAVFGRNGSVIASVDSSGVVNVWDIDGHSVAILRGHEGPVSSVRFRGDDQVVSSGADGTVRVWDIDRRALLMTFENTDGIASYVDVSADGTAILKSAENGQALRLLKCEVCGPSSSVVELARSRAFRTLTPEEERAYASSS